MQRTFGRSRELLNLTYLNDDEILKLYGEPTQGFKALNKKSEEKLDVSDSGPSEAFRGR